MSTSRRRRLRAAPSELRSRQLRPLANAHNHQIMSGLSLQTTGGVSSRFVSANELDAAKAEKDKQWKAAYER